MTEHFPKARKAVWDFHGVYTSSPQIPQVEFAGIMHPGLIGCLPSRKLLDTWNKREAKLVSTDPTRLPNKERNPVPVYEFECAGCGPFSELRPLAQASAPAACPHCGRVAPKIFPAVNLRAMRPQNRVAWECNERSAHAPHTCGTGCSHGQLKPKPKSRPQPGDRPALQYSTRENRRPWMLGH